MRKINEFTDRKTVDEYFYLLEKEYGNHDKR